MPILPPGPTLQKSPGGRFKPPSIPCMLDFKISSARRPASLKAAAMRSSSISRSVADPLRPATAAGSMEIFSTSFLPFILTVTAPPPDEASITVWLSFCCICSCISLAWPSISWILNGFMNKLLSLAFAQVEYAAHFRSKQLLRLADQRVFEGDGLDASAGRDGRLGCQTRAGSAGLAGDEAELLIDADGPERALADLLRIGVHGEAEHGFLDAYFDFDAVALFAPLTGGEQDGGGAVSLGFERGADGVANEVQVERGCGFGGKSKGSGGDFGNDFRGGYRGLDGRRCRLWRGRGFERCEGARWTRLGYGERDWCFDDARLRNRLRDRYYGDWHRGDVHRGDGLRYRYSYDYRPAP